MKEVRMHIENEFWNTAVNRMYYACFYAVSALLLRDNIEAKSHSGARYQFGQHFVKTGKVNRELGRHYTELFDKRLKSDYNDFFTNDRTSVLELYTNSMSFIETIEYLLYK